MSEPFEAVGTCCLCEKEIQDIVIIGNRGFCRECLEKLKKVLKHL